MAKKRMDRVDKIIAYEDGSLSEKDTIKMFQEMVNDGSVWKLQGHYGRTASELIKAGLVELPKKTTYDAYGNRIMTRSEYAKKRKQLREVV